MATKDISDLQCCQAAVGGGRTGERLAAMTGQPDKVCERALERAVGRGYLGCGMGAWWAFLEPKGEQLLKDN